jgi:two-component system, sensor histidine kinase PdtaS
LPERLRGRVPPALVELAIGFVIPALMTLLRIPFLSVTGDRAPYAFMFIGAAVATLLAGWRSGVIAVVLGQLLTWRIIVLPLQLPTPEVRGALIVATASQLIVVLIIAFYQREVDKGTAEREQRLELLDHALREIDHRTRNNYQTVLAMIELQARRASNDGVRDALEQVADRIQGVAAASQHLALQSGSLDAVRLDEHLCGLVGQIERGLSRDGIEVECKVDDVTASPDAATSISIIVNELVTNAIKHAFNGERSGHVWVTGKVGSSFELIVADDGRGTKPRRRDGQSGLGTKLVESFVRQLSASHEVISTEKGTTHRLVIPSLD